jgi:hypothetical protein
MRSLLLDYCTLHLYCNTVHLWGRHFSVSTAHSAQSILVVLHSADVLLVRTAHPVSILFVSGCRLTAELYCFAI